MTTTTLAERIEAFERSRRSACRLVWVERVMQPAAHALQAKLRFWPVDRPSEAARRYRVILAVLNRCLRPLLIEDRVSRCDPPSEADTERVLAAANCFDPDTVDWRGIVPGPLGVKLNALRRERVR